MANIELNKSNLYKKINIVVINNQNDKLYYISNKDLHSEEVSFESNMCSLDRLPAGGVCGGTSMMKFRCTYNYELQEALYIARDDNSALNVYYEYYDDDNNVIEIEKIIKSFYIDSIDYTENKSCIDVVAYSDFEKKMNADITFRLVNYAKNQVLGQMGNPTLAEFFNAIFPGVNLNLADYNDAFANMIVDLSKMYDKNNGSSVPATTTRQFINDVFEIFGLFLTDDITSDINGYSDILSGWIVEPKSIKKSLYPSRDIFPSNEIYPANLRISMVDEIHDISKKYSAISCSNNTMKETTGIYAYDNQTEDVNVAGNSDKNVYTIKNNYIYQLLGVADRDFVINEILARLNSRIYRPCNTDILNDFEWKLGDTFYIDTRMGGIYTYMLKRVVTGIQDLRCNLSSEGTQTWENNDSYEMTNTRASNNIIRNISNVMSVGNASDKIEQLYAWLIEANKQLKELGKQGLTGM